MSVNILGASSSGSSDEGAAPLITFMANAGYNKKSFATTANQTYLIKFIGNPNTTITIMSGVASSGQYYNVQNFALYNNITGEVTGTWTPATSGDTLIVNALYPVTVVIRQYTGATTATYSSPARPNSAINDSSYASSPTFGIGCAAYGPSGVVIGNNYGNVYTSTADGLSWASTLTANTTGQGTVAAAYGNGYYVISKNQNLGLMYSSTDGASWTASSGQLGSGYFTGLSWNAGFNMWVGVYNTGIYTTSNASASASWVSRATMGAAGGNYGNVVSNSTTTIVFSNPGIYYSTNGTTWNTSTVTSLASAAMYAAAWSPTLSLWVAVGSGGTIGTSPDAVTWTKRTSPTTNNLYGVTWNATLSQFVAVGVTQTVVYSSDGINWSSGNYAVPGDPNNIVSGGGYMVAAGANDSVITSTTTSFGSLAHTATGGVATNGTRVVIGGNNGAIATSDDLGYTWTNRTSNLPSSPISLVTYANSLFVAVTQSGAVSTSPDGITWTLRGAAGTAAGATGIAYGNGIWVIVIGSSTSVTSPDGFTWTARTNLPNMSGTVYGSIAFGNGYFAAVNQQGGAIRSSDGINWTPWTYVSIGSTSGWVTVWFGGGLHNFHAASGGTNYLQTASASQIANGQGLTTTTNQLWYSAQNAGSPAGGFSSNGYNYLYAAYVATYYYIRTGFTSNGTYIWMTSYISNGANPGLVSRTNAPTIV